MSEVVVACRISEPHSCPICWARGHVLGDGGICSRCGLWPVEGERAAVGS